MKLPQGQWRSDAALPRQTVAEKRESPKLQIFFQVFVLHSSEERVGEVPHIEGGW
jgi:hypothetical protein